ncbi:MAG: hypothetical protein HYY52_02435 [Candidatus Melainabacteria bacterium]|nr:hypothetical protein [Candidatus Melainabacteria bacterium]
MDILSKISISKKEISKFEITQKNPLGLTCEKIAKNPRDINFSQIKEAIENILLPENLTDLIRSSIEFILKDLFLYMHQTGLYNRQLKLWKTIANITQISIFKLQERIFKKRDLNILMIDFFIDPKSPCMKAILDQNEEISYEHFKKFLNQTTFESNTNRLKGIFYFLKPKLDDHFVLKLIQDTCSIDAISRYESILNGTKDVRLNVINFNEKDKKYEFKLAYPNVTRHEKQKH